jgi:hypothetical protein
VAQLDDYPENESKVREYLGELEIKPDYIQHGTRTYPIETRPVCPDCDIDMKNTVSLSGERFYSCMNQNCHNLRLFTSEGNLVNE